jgi:1-acyl-sn-glycerol-3-phosphate acyltransferase
LLYQGVKLVVGTALTVAYHPRVDGLGHVPTSGPAILAGNHVSFSDHFFVPLVVPRKVIYLAKADYFDRPGLRGRLTAAFFNAAGQKPVDRSSGRAGLAAIQTAVDVLAEGNLLGIYPEGTRSPDGKLYRGRVGVARLWLESAAPLLPCAVIGTDVVQPPGRRVPRLAPVAVRFGPPLDLRRYDGRKRDARLFREMTDDIMRAIQDLSGQEYVDIYATTVKEELAAAREAAQ